VSWKKNITEGFNRISIVLGVLFAIIGGLLTWGGSNGNIFYTIIFVVVGYWLGRGIIIIINWIINGFVGK
jgi:hypothetical protein